MNILESLTISLLIMLVCVWLGNFKMGLVLVAAYGIHLYYATNHLAYLNEKYSPDQLKKLKIINFGTR